MAGRGCLIEPSDNSTRSSPIDVDALLRSVAAHGLPAGQAVIRKRALSDEDWARLLAGAVTQRLVPRLSRAVSDGMLAATTAQIEELREAAFADGCRVLALESALVDTVDVLVGNRIDYRVLKGSSVARLDYPDPSLRSFVDVDILVRADQIDAAGAAITSAGCRRLIPERAPGFDRRFGKGATFRTPDGFEVDLHRTFDRGPLGNRIILSDLWLSSSTFHVGEKPLLALDRELRFLGVCFHAALSDVPARLTSLCDVAQIAYEPRLDVERLLGLARRWDCEAVVARAVRLAWTVLALREPSAVSDWAARYRTSRRDERALALYLDPNRSHAARVIATVWSLRGLAPKLAYLKAAAFPSVEYRSAMGESRFTPFANIARPWRYMEAGDDHRVDPNLDAESKEG